VNIAPVDVLAGMPNNFFAHVCRHFRVSQRGNETVANTIQGGTGTWNNATSNWTNANASVNAPWQNGIAIFQSTAGTVTLGANIRFFGMQFVTTGYTIVAPGNQTLIGSQTTIFQVGPGGHCNDCCADRGRTGSCGDFQG
jgi:hypothetical protein